MTKPIESGMFAEIAEANPELDPQFLKIRREIVDATGLDPRKIRRLNDESWVTDIHSSTVVTCPHEAVIAELYKGEKLAHVGNARYFIQEFQVGPIGNTRHRDIYFIGVDPTRTTSGEVLAAFHREETQYPPFRIASRPGRGSMRAV